MRCGIRRPRKTIPDLLSILPMRIAPKTNFAGFVRQHLKSTLVAVTAMIAIATGVLFYSLRPAVDVTYDHMAGDSIFFEARNNGIPAKTISIDVFVLSTAKFGRIAYDEFEEPLAGNHTVVAGGEAKNIVVAAPADTQPYLCSQLRSIGFFLDYGKLSNGKLVENSTPRRAQDIIDDLRCSFTISETTPAQTDALTHKVRTNCSKVSWLSDCVATVLPAAN
jgi:hypothetical protein